MTETGGTKTAAPLATVKDYDEMHQALRDRAQQLGVTYESIDAVAGFQSGYAAKLLSPVQIRAVLGPKTFGPLAGALGVMFLVVEDPAAKHYVDRLTSRKPSAMRCRRPVRKMAQELGNRGAQTWLTQSTSEQRRGIATKGGRGRWRKLWRNRRRREKRARMLAAQHDQPEAKQHMEKKGERGPGSE